MDDARTLEETPRGDDLPEWEVFCRETVSDPLHHVGSVTAPSPEIAHEQAAQLFGDDRRDVWLCAAGDIHRFSSYSLAEAGGAES